MGANTILLPNKGIYIRPNKSPNTGFFEKMVKWVAYDTIGALLPIRMTNFSNSSGNATEKIKRKRWKQNKKCLHKCNYFLLLAGNLKCSCYLLLARKKCNLRWIQNTSWDQWWTVVYWGGKLLILAIHRNTGKLHPC